MVDRTIWLTRWLASLRWKPSLKVLDTDLRERISALPSEDARITALLKRADTGVASLNKKPWWPADIDVLCSGGGNMVAYFIGFHCVLSALSSRGSLTLGRYAGASSGAKAILMILAGGDAEAAHFYLACADSQAANGGAGPALVDHQQRWVASLLTERWWARNPKVGDLLTGRAHVSVTTPFNAPRAKLHNDFETPDKVQEAFVATGTFYARCRGLWSCDGAIAQPCNKPIWQDGRSQLVVDLLKAPGMSLVYAWRVPSFEVFERGVEDALAFFASESLDQAHAALPAVRLWSGSAA